MTAEDALDHVATVGALFDGGDVPVCSECIRHVTLGQIAIVRLQRQADAEEWTVSRLYCAECGVDEIDHPAEGWEEALVSGYVCPRGRLYADTTRIEAYSSPAVGNPTEDDIALMARFEADASALTTDGGHPPELEGRAVEDVAEDLEAVRERSVEPAVQRSVAMAREHLIDGDFAEAVEEIDRALPKADLGRGEELTELRAVLVELSGGEA